MPRLTLTRRLKRAVTSVMVERVVRADRRERADLPREHGGLTPELWGCGVNDRGELAIRDVSLVDLARQHGTPLHVVDRERLVRNVEDFLGPFRQRYPRVRLASSYKTNPVPGVLQILHEAGTLAEVISPFELWLALQLGVPGEQIVYNGPGKTPESLRQAVEAGIRLIHIDGLHEIETIAAAAREFGKRPRVGLRVVTSVGWSGQFGLSLADGSALGAFAEMQRHPELEPVGLHLHIGTGVKDVAAYATAVEEVLRFAGTLQRNLGVTIESFDFGGGFGVPTVRTRSAWDDRLNHHGHPARLAIPAECPTPDDYAAALIPLIRKHCGDREPEILLEPGRAITSSAQVLLLKVLAVKEAGDGRRSVILDGGKNLTLPLEWETHQIFPASRMNEPEAATCDLYGPLCHPGDVLARHKRMPAPRAGDILAVMDAGAYFVPNQLNFSQPRPAIVLIEGRHVRCLRERERFEDIVRLDECVRTDAGSRAASPVVFPPGAT